MDRPEMGFFNGITATTRRLLQEEERASGEAEGGDDGT